jgi:hypothetical protein
MGRFFLKAGVVIVKAGVVIVSVYILKAGRVL